ncbi:MAG: hypothetical protein LBL45_03680 [Treponema sp.]|nr:hypothetical protein [Treponema sp.]
MFLSGAMAVPYGEPIQGIRSPSGPSSVFDPEGRLTASGDGEKAEVVYCEVDPRKEWGIHRIRMEDRSPKLYRSLADEGSKT